MVILLVVSLFCLNMEALINKTRTQIKKNTVVERRNTYTEPENISAKNITIAFKLSDFYAINNYVDPYYGQMYLK